MNNLIIGMTVKEFFNV